MTVLVACAIVGLLWGVKSASAVVAENLEKTNCNQAMLVFRLTGVKDMEKFRFCSPAIKTALRSKGIIP